jgi:hypothetical protein
MKKTSCTSWRYIKKKIEFIYGTLTSTETSSQDEEDEARPSGTTHEEEMQIENHMNSKEGVRKTKNHRQLKNKNKWRLFQQQRKSKRYRPWK